MPSTFTHGVVPSACLALTAKVQKPIPRRELLKLALIGFFLGNGPDLDVIPGTLWSTHWNDIHRNWGHNIFSITALILLGTWLFKKFVAAEYRPKRVLLVSTILVLSHIAFDSMSEAGAHGIRTGVPVFWPLSDWQLIAPFYIFRNFETDIGYNPIMAHVMSSQFWSRAVFMEVFFTITFVPFWVVSFLVAKKVQGRLTRSQMAKREEDLNAA